MGFEEAIERLGIAAQSVSQIRLGQGVVGKTTWALVAALIVLGIVAWRLPDPLIVGVIAAALFLVYLVSVMVFASRNPGLSLLEGADLVLWQQMDLAAKGIEAPRRTQVTTDPSVPPLPGPGGKG